MRTHKRVRYPQLSCQMWKVGAITSRNSLSHCTKLSEVAYLMRFPKFVLFRGRLTGHCIAIVRRSVELVN